MQSGDALYENAVNMNPGEFVGYPFPRAEPDRLLDIGKLWTIELLWDDIDVETSPADQARATQEILQVFLLQGDVATVKRQSLEIQKRVQPIDLIRDVLLVMKEKHGTDFIKSHAEGMHRWYRAARLEEALAHQFQMDTAKFEFDTFFNNRCVTVGSTAGMSIDYVYNYHIPAAFHQQPAIQELKNLAAAACAIDNDLCSVRKDLAKDWPSSITARMKLQGLTLMAALERACSDHIQYCTRFDELALQIAKDERLKQPFPFVDQYIQQMRLYTSGVTLWETRAARYSGSLVVIDGRVVVPEVRFIAV